MAHYDEIGEFGLGQLLARRLTTPGGAVAPTVAPELFPCVTVESDRPEWGYLKGEQLAGKYVSRGAVAGQYSMAQFYLPSTARGIAVITKIANRNANAVSVAQAVGISAGLAGWAAIANTGRDFRWPAERVQLIAEQMTNVGLPSTYAALDILVASGQEYTSPIVISPGTSLILWNGTVNLALQASVSWYERGAQPGELV